MNRSIPSRRRPSPLVALLLAGLLLAAGPSIAAGKDQVLDRAYAGVLHVQFNCSFPEWEVSTQMDVQLLRNGTLVVEPGNLQYGGTEDLQAGCIYTRDQGNWDIAPTGSYMTGPPEHIAVSENVSFSEHLNQTCPDPVGVVFDEYPSGVLNGGLAFDFDEAQLDGAVVEVVNGSDVIRWTLGLVPSLPARTATWTAVKALYR